MFLFLVTQSVHTKDSYEKLIPKAQPKTDFAVLCPVYIIPESVLCFFFYLCL